MEILITSKTRKGKAACVGGLILNNNRFVRLLNPGNWDQYADTNFNIGSVWDIDFNNRIDNTPPHVEDIIIYSKRYIREIKPLSDFLLQKGITIFRGSPRSIFDGKLGWTFKGSGYIGNKSNLPENSVGFWISDKDLKLSDDSKHYTYSDDLNNTIKRFPYVGFEPAINTIAKGTLLRISLARWWKPEDSDINERCYLQLSGWYE